MPAPADAAAADLGSDSQAPAPLPAPLPAPVPESAPEPARLLLHMPVDVRSLSLAVLAVLACLFALQLARAVFVPLLLGLALSYALSPVVNQLQRWRVPRALGAAILLMAIGVGAGWTVYSLSDDATALIESLPAATQKVRAAVHAHRGGSESAIDKVQRAAAQLEQAAQEGAPAPTSVPRGVTRVSIERGRFDITDYLWTGTLGVAATAGQAVVVMFIAFFMLSSGNSFRRKMVRIAGPTFARRRITVQMLDEITGQIHRYLLVQVLTSVLVGLATGLAFAAVGLEHAVVWGVVAFVLNFIPYLGSIAIAVGAALVAFVQFGTANMALSVAAIALAIHTVSGNLLTPWLTSRAGHLNAVTVFVGVLAFGWLWGVWGLLLGAPILSVVKAVCDRVEDLKPIGELIGS